MQYDEFLKLFGTSPVSKTTLRPYLLRSTPMAAGTLWFTAKHNFPTDNEVTVALNNLLAVHEHALYMEGYDPRSALTLLKAAFADGSSMQTESSHITFSHMLFHSVITDRFGWASTDLPALDLRQISPFADEYVTEDKKAAALWATGMTNWRMTVRTFMAGWKTVLSGDAFLLGERSTDGQTVTEKLFRTCTRFEKATQAVMVMGHLCDAALGLRALYKVRHCAAMPNYPLIDFAPVHWSGSAS